MSVIEEYKPKEKEQIIADGKRVRILWEKREKRHRRRHGCAIGCPESPMAFIEQLRKQTISRR